MCPVCGYPDLESQPVNHEICPSCGTQFGYDDYLRSHAALRQEWLSSGAQWFLKGYQPYCWNAYRQLENAGLIRIEQEPKTKTTVGIVNRPSVKFDYVKFRDANVRTVNLKLDFSTLFERNGRLATT